VNCEQVEEYISALCDGDKIPHAAAEHIGTCPGCQSELREYATIGAELRRLASLDEPQFDRAPIREPGISTPTWFEKGRATMKIPRFAFALMLIAILVLSGGLVIVRARAGSASDRFLELKYKSPATGTNICIMRSDGNQKDNLCDFVNHSHSGLLLMNTRLIARTADSAALAIRAKYVPGAADLEVNYSEALFRDIPERVLALQPGRKQQIEVAGLGTLDVEGEFLDHVPPLFLRPQEPLDPNPREFRIVAPVLVRDNRVIAHLDGSSIDTGSSDATLMLYVPGEGRYLMSVVPFEGAVEGNVHLGQITFSLDSHNYLLLTSMPITVSEHVWAKRDPDFKPSERMVRQSEARDDRPMFLVRSLNRLQQQRIEH
jgi:hypothetical protein